MSAIDLIKKRRTQYAIGKNIELSQSEVEELVRETVRETPSADRKSTRLNSSHVRISYAVFCLKKKSERVANALQLSVVEPVIHVLVARVSDLVSTVGM